MTQNIYFHHGGFHAMNQFIGSIQEIIVNKNKFVSNPCFYGCSAGGGYALACYLVYHGYIPIDKVECQKQNKLTVARINREIESWAKTQKENYYKKGLIV
jgi:hypothetical protein